MMTGGLWDNGSRGECRSQWPAMFRRLLLWYTTFLNELLLAVHLSFPGPYATVLEDLLKERSTDFALVKYEDLWAAEQRQLGRGWSSIGYWYGLGLPVHDLGTLC